MAATHLKRCPRNGDAPLAPAVQRFFDVMRKSTELQTVPSKISTLSSKPIPGIPMDQRGKGRQGSVGVALHLEDQSTDEGSTEGSQQSSSSRVPGVQTSDHAALAGTMPTAISLNSILPPRRPRRRERGNRNAPKVCPHLADRVSPAPKMKSCPNLGFADTSHGAQGSEVDTGFASGMLSTPASPLVDPGFKLRADGYQEESVIATAVAEACLEPDATESPLAASPRVVPDQGPRLAASPRVAPDLGPRLLATAPGETAGTSLGALWPPSKLVGSPESAAQARHQALPAGQRTSCEPCSVPLTSSYAIRRPRPEDAPLKVFMMKYECEVRPLDPGLPAFKRPLW